MRNAHDRYALSTQDALAGAGNTHDESYGCRPGGVQDEEAVMSEKLTGRTPLPFARAADEFLLCIVLLFIVVTMVRWVRAPDSPLHIADLHGALAVLGPLSGVVLVALIYSPPGRRSGGHMNPAVTIGLWLTDAFPGASVLPYVAAQLGGSLLGTELGQLVWGTAAAGPTVGNAAVRPGPGWGSSAVFLAETASVIVVILLVGHFLAHPAYSRWLPVTVGLFVALLIVVLGAYSGGSANPARQFGPAIIAGQADMLWVYLLAPVVGAVLGASVHHLLFRRFQIREPLSYKLDGSGSVPPADTAAAAAAAQTS
jgi:glycerol uptake facilitator-like aquaporin